MLSRTKQVAIRATAQRPVFRLLPPGGLRIYAAVQYYGESVGRAGVDRYLRSVGAVPTRNLTTAIIAAKAIFRAGMDDLLEETLTNLERRHPGSAAPHLMWADLHSFHGRSEQALASVARAVRRSGRSTATRAREVRLSYRVRSRDDADQLAVTAVREFPLSVEVLRQVAAACATQEQYRRIDGVWRERVSDPLGLPRVVRQLAMAAARSGEIELATDLYRQAIVRLSERRRPAPRVTETSLGGLGAQTAIQDLCAVLDGAEIPFFFAAGTALGLVRAGRPLRDDGDVDVGIFDADWDRDALLDLFARHPRFDLSLHPQTSKVGLRHRGGSPVDIFRFYPQDGRIWHDGVFVRWHNSPFQVRRQEVGGRSVPLPTNTDMYLTENYGDWRTPRPAFDAFTDDAPNLEITWPEYQRMHLVRRAYQYLARNQVEQAQRELRRAGEEVLARKIRPGARSDTR